MLFRLFAPPADLSADDDLVASRHVRFQDIMPGHSIRRLILLMIVGLSLAASACGTKYVPAPVDTAHARETLAYALECWKEGLPPEQLQEDDPPILVTDVDWNSGSRLTEYALTGAGQSADGNLVIPVMLTLTDERGSQIEKSVTYLVTTSPSLTVMRDLMIP